jgi:2-keto-4-pentenoate hydratase
MIWIDPRLRSALQAQLEIRAMALRAGARHVGWKLGMGDRESIAGHIAVGFLTSATVLDEGRYEVSSGAYLHADAEALVEIGADVDPSGGIDAVANAIGGFGAALELVDLSPVDGEPEAVITSNVFHRAVVFAGEAIVPSRGLEVQVAVDGEMRAVGRWPADLRERIASAAELLDAVGEKFRAGDKVITGSIVQVPVGSRARVDASFGGQARIGVSVESNLASDARAV